MSNGTDISKLVELIMSDPDLMNRIKSLKEGSERDDEDRKIEPTIADATREIHSKGGHKGRRGALLCALKPYLSKDRGKAIDTMLTALEVFDLIKGG